MGGCTTTIVGAATCQFGHVVVGVALAAVRAVGVVVAASGAASAVVVARRAAASDSVDLTVAATVSASKGCHRQCRAFRVHARSSAIGRLARVRRSATGRVVLAVRVRRSAIGRVVLAVLVDHVRRLAIVVRVRVDQVVRAARRSGIVVRAQVGQVDRRRWAQMRGSSKTRSGVGVRLVSATS